MKEKPKNISGLRKRAEDALHGKTEEVQELSIREA
jgi:hypothetical protein